MIVMSRKILSIISLLFWGYGFGQLPVDYSLYYSSDKIYNCNSPSQLIPADKIEVDVPTIYNMRGGRVVDWFVECGETGGGISVGHSVVEAVNIGTERDMKVRLSSAGGEGKLVVLFNFPIKNDSLRIAVWNYRKSGKPMVVPEEPVFRLGSRDFSVYTYADSLGSDSTRSKSYIDGFGRVVQRSDVGGSPLGGDIINLTAYDRMGRQSRKYLPFVADTLGALVYNPAYQRSYYEGKYPDSAEDAPYAYTSTEYDSPAVGTIIRSSGAGADISIDGPRGGSPTVTEYRQSDADSVWRFEIDPLNPERVYKRSYYTYGTLLAKSTFMEYGDSVFDKTTEFTDCEGNKVMTENFDSDGRIYYVYDIYGRLCYTIPEVCAASMTENTSYGWDDSMISRYCYLNVYDERGNVIREYSPASEPKILIYDRRDRLILARDGNHSAASQWAFSKYDVFDRPVMTGILYGGTEDYHRQRAAACTELFETRSGAPSSLHLYTNRCYPVIVPDSSEVYGVNYYDDYSWDDIAWGGAENGVNLWVSGQLTRTKTKVLGEQKWLNKVVYYDEKYRKVKMLSELYPDGTQTDIRRYDFRGNMVEETVRQSGTAGQEGFVRHYTYDDWGRLTGITQSTDGDTRNGLVELVTYTHDDLGEISTRRFHDSERGARTVYRRNLTGTDVRQSGPVNMRMKYGQAGNYFSGSQPYTRLTEFTWDSQHGNNGYAYDYDDRGRLTRGAYLQLDGSSPSQDEYDIVTAGSVELEYDTRTDNILGIARSGNNMPMSYEGYRMTTVRMPGGQTSEKFLYDAAGNLTYDGQSRQHYRYNPLGRLASVFDTAQRTDTVNVFTDVWLAYTRPQSEQEQQTLHEDFPEYIDEHGDIDERYRVPDASARYEYYFIPKKYPSLRDLMYVYEHSNSLNLVYEYCGQTPELSVQTQYEDYIEVDVERWIHRRSTPSSATGMQLHAAYPDYFDENGAIYEIYRMSYSNDECFIIPAEHPELSDETVVHVISSGAYHVYPYIVQPPVSFEPITPYFVSDNSGVPVMQGQYLRLSFGQITEEDFAAYHDYRSHAVESLTFYVDSYSGMIRDEYRIVDDYYYIPEEYYSLLGNTFGGYEFIDWEIVNEAPGIVVPPSVIHIFTGLQKRMESVYGGDGEKLAVRFFDNDTVSSVIYYNGAFTYESHGWNPSTRTLRDIATPEGVVTKSGGNYYYKYFLRDYLGNVRDVLSCSKSGGYQEEQFTDYDPLGLAISKIGNDNPYLYNGKELYPDFSDSYEGVYDFGARYYNPLYGRWFAPDPEKQHLNPYIYCGNNPVMKIDPNGRFWVPGQLKILLDKVKFAQAELKRIRRELLLSLNQKGVIKDKNYYKAWDEVEDINMRLKGIREDKKNIRKLDKSETVYEMKYVDSDRYVTYKASDGHVVIEYGSLGTGAHERGHNVQWLKKDGFEERFNKDGYLTNPGRNADEMTQNEVQAYRLQYSYDGKNLFPVGINSYKDINAHTISKIVDTKNNPLYPFAKKSIDYLMMNNKLND